MTSGFHSWTQILCLWVKSSVSQSQLSIAIICTVCQSQTWSPLESEQNFIRGPLLSNPWAMPSAIATQSQKTILENIWRRCTSKPDLLDPFTPGINIFSVSDYVIRRKLHDRGTTLHSHLAVISIGVACIMPFTGILQY